MPSMPNWKAPGRLRKAPVLGLMILCLTLCCACSTRERLLRQVEVQRLTPPSLLLRDTPTPAWSGHTNRDLLNFTLALRAALRNANADKAALRAWAAEAAEGETPPASRQSITQTITRPIPQPATQAKIQTSTQTIIQSSPQSARQPAANPQPAAQPEEAE